MTFSVPASKKSIKQNRFEFEIGGEKYDVPLLKFAPVGAMEAFEADKNTTGMILVADSERARDAIRTLDGSQIEGLMKAWGEASDITPGESQGSSDS